MAMASHSQQIPIYGTFDKKMDGENGKYDIFEVQRFVRHTEKRHFGVRFCVTVCTFLLVAWMLAHRPVLIGDAYIVWMFIIGFHLGIWQYEKWGLCLAFVVIVLFSGRWINYVIDLNRWKQIVEWIWHIILGWWMLVSRWKLT